MKFQIRRERNQFDPRMSMYNVYDADKFKEGTARGYLGGFASVGAAQLFIESHRTQPLSELVAEVEV
jgi:hypothetical protein